MVQWHNRKDKTNPKKKAAKRKPRKDTNQIAHRVVQEIIRRSR